MRISLIQRLMVGVSGVVLCSLLLAGCGSSGGGTMGIQEDLALKRRLLLEHQSTLTGQQKKVLLSTRFQSEDQAQDLVARFLEINEARASLEGSDVPSLASDVLLRQQADND